MVGVHQFDNEGEAYDASQYRDDIKDGDLLVTPHSIGILIEAWPTCYVCDGLTPNDQDNVFHTLRVGASWSSIQSVHGGTHDYTESTTAAQALWDAR